MSRQASKRATTYRGAYYSWVGNLQEAKAEHKGKTYLLRLFRVQFPYLTNRQDENRNVGKYGGARVGYPHAHLAHTMSGEFWVPQLLRRHAYKGEEKSGGYSPYDDEAANANDQ